MRRIQPKLTLLELFICLSLGYTLQNSLFMLFMFLFCFRVYENIVAKDYNEPIDIVFEDIIR